MGMVFKSGVYGTLGATLNAGDTTITLSTGQGARFNTWLVTQYDYTWLTVIKLSDPLKPYERIKIKGPLTGDTIPVVARGQDGTSALSFNSGERVEIRLCAPMLDRFVEAEDIQTLADLRATLVGGTADAITAVHAYPLSDLVGVGNAPTDGMASLFVPTATNTTATPTFAPDGLSAATIVEGANKPLSQGSLRANQQALVVYSGTLGKWVLITPAGRGYEAIASISSGTIGRTYRGKVVPVTLSPTLAIEAAATLGSDFWCVVQNAGTGNVTLDPSGAEVIRMPDGSTYATRTLGPGSALLTCDGAQISMFPFDGTSNISVYSVAGTYTHRYNPLTKKVLAIAIGGGGRGGDNDGSVGSSTGGGGGSGGYAAASTTTFGLSDTVTVGAGGNTGTPNGGTSSFGSIVSATGGTGGSSGSGGGPGGGGAGGSPNGVAGSAGGTNGGNGGVSVPSIVWGATGGVGSNGSVAATSGTEGGAGGGGGRGTGSFKPGADGRPGEVIVIESI